MKETWLRRRPVGIFWIEDLEVRVIDDVVAEVFHEDRVGGAQNLPTIAVVFYNPSRSARYANSGLLWSAPIEWSGLIVSAWSAFGPLERRSLVRAGGSPAHCAA